MANEQWAPHSELVHRADHDVIIGYRGTRSSVQDLVLGPGAMIRSGTVIYAGSRIGKRLETGHHVVIREECEIEDDVSVWSNTVIDYGCRIGDNVKIHANCYVAQYTELGSNAFLAPGVTIANDLYPGRAESAEVMSGPVIGAGAQLGVNVTVLPYVRIGEAALIGAGAVVTRDIPPGAVAFGNPASVRGEVGRLAPVSSRIVADPGSASRYRLRRGACPPVERGSESGSAAR
jgi:acetyltransferase-like isoleucine patch superfamily enzyme